MGHLVETKVVSIGFLVHEHIGKIYLAVSLWDTAVNHLAALSHLLGKLPPINSKERKEVQKDSKQRIANGYICDESV